MDTNALQAFAEATFEQVKTVYQQTKTAAIVIFVCGLLTGCVFF